MGSGIQSLREEGVHRTGKTVAGSSETVCARAGKQTARGGE